VSLACLVAAAASIVGGIVVGNVQRVVEQKFFTAPDAALCADLNPQHASRVAHLDRLDIWTTRVVDVPGEVTAPSTVDQGSVRE